MIIMVTVQHRDNYNHHIRIMSLRYKAPSPPSVAKEQVAETGITSLAEPRHSTMVQTQDWAPDVIRMSVRSVHWHGRRQGRTRLAAKQGRV